MTMHPKRLFPALTVLFAATALAQSLPQGQPAAAQTNAKPTASHTAAKQDDEGERIFQQRCSRCHNAPEGFPSRISGTIAHHMRVRASLSADDQEKLLHFLNP
jgi:cytochrome c5